MQVELTTRQVEYVREAHHRWNFAVGAVRSGKSHLAVFYTIPNRVIELKGKKGLNVILGSTYDNIRRNVVEPMQQIWGDKVVTDINGHNICHIAGERVLCVGAQTANMVSRLRGSEIKFCYIDEACDIHPDVFQMLKSRLSLPYSECHAACNPEGPKHYIKQFLDQAADGVDIYCQHYTIYDNPFLPEEYVHALETEYKGTVYFDRYILGKWTQAEGLVWPNFELALEDRYEGEAAEYCVSCDYGTQNAFAAYLWARSSDMVWHAVSEYYFSGRDEGHQKTDADYVDDMLAFCESVPGRTVEFIVDPSAASFIEALRRSGRFRVRGADNNVPDGIRDVAVCMQNGSVKIGDNCKMLISELHGYIWDTGRSGDSPVKENDHACDALRYFVRTKRVYRPQVKYVSPFEPRPRKM